MPWPTAPAARAFRRERPFRRTRPRLHCMGRGRGGEIASPPAHDCVASGQISRRWKPRHPSEPGAPHSGKTRNEAAAYSGTQVSDFSIHPKTPTGLGLVFENRRGGKSREPSSNHRRLGHKPPRASCGKQSSRRNTQKTRGIAGGTHPEGNGDGAKNQIAAPQRSSSYIESC